MQLHCQNCWVDKCFLNRLGVAADCVESSGCDCLGIIREALSGDDIAVFFVQVQNSNELLFFYDKKILVFKFSLQVIEIKQ